MPMALELSMQHQVLEFYQVCSNDDPGSDLVPYAFVYEKGKTHDILETIVVYDVKVGRCS